MLFDTKLTSDRCIGYKIQLTKEKPMIQFSGRNPIIAILVNGGEVATNPTPGSKLELQKKNLDI